MSTDQATHLLPTLDRLGVADPVGVSAVDVSKAWFDEFSSAVESKEVPSVVNLFLEDGFWKDIIALTWDLRSIGGHSDIKRLLDARLSITGLSELKLSSDPNLAPVFYKPYPDLALVRFCFEFATNYGKGTGVCNLVPVKENKWKAYALLTCLDSLKDFPEKVGALRNSTADHGTWQERINAQTEFPNNDPTVVVVGAGHTGLEIAARLKYIGVPTLVIDRKPRVGDSWRDRYKALCLHDTIWYNQTPYLPFPSTWPVYSPAPKLADWLEGYAKFLELSVWTASTITKTSWDEKTKTWTVEISRGGHGTRTLSVKHLVFATGFGGRAVVPDIPGKTSYKGIAVHSSEFTSAADYVGKKAIVVGACNSGHDIAQDFYNHGIDITMRRSSTFVVSVKAVAQMLGAVFKEGFPTDLGDILNSSLPNAVVRQLHIRMVPDTANTTDKDLLEGLAKVGFKTNLGPYGAGIIPLLYERAGGYYMDTGTSSHIASGGIKIKNGSSIESFTENGLKLTDGTELQADVIVFATGYGDPRDSMREVCSPEVAAKVGQVWGVDDEGQVPGVWRNCGHEGLWFGIGNLALSRFHSLHLAMQIKAIEEGILKKSEVTF
ncbi:hypothetical protein BJ138DRAFT_1214828 [Hygrophoropsis aurantiaca]|uniref:Uncharacterized protein n=1 Tax=Hygrophoropsis aurantiaca TaxID=72124 RepID=A0ACB8A2A2_9AGAM|nr:hypothetical protein BJ138DRAFT_1214828 [Hygrophoropsis aurantiaca]